jgi:hypothetical protein
MTQILPIPKILFGVSHPLSLKTTRSTVLTILEWRSIATAGITLVQAKCFLMWTNYIFAI